ncbi:Pyruvate dehydrogenase E1 component [Streptomyces misionensis JCM 4497]
MRPPGRNASRDGIQSLTGRRARRLDSIVRHASDTLGADGQQSPIRSTRAGPGVPPVAGHGSGPARVRSEPGCAHHSYGALAPAYGAPCRLA